MKSITGYLVIATLMSIRFSRQNASGYSRDDSPSNCKFHDDLDSTQCFGLTEKQNVSSASVCKVLCCVLPDCTIWQYHPRYGCWIGNDQENSYLCIDRDNEWVGGSFHYSRRTYATLAGASKGEEEDTPAESEAKSGGTHTTSRIADSKQSFNNTSADRVWSAPPPPCPSRSRCASDSACCPPRPVYGPGPPPRIQLMGDFEAAAGMPASTVAAAEGTVDTLVDHSLAGLLVLCRRVAVGPGVSLPPAHAGTNLRDWVAAACGGVRAAQSRPQNWARPCHARGGCPPAQPRHPTPVRRLRPGR